MKIEQIQELESYFNTDNKHYNSNTFKMLCEVLKRGDFDNPETPLFIFSGSFNMFTENHETPLKAIELLELETNNHDINLSQKIFIYKWIRKYLRHTEFDEVNLDKIEGLIKSKIEGLEEELNKLIQHSKPLVGNIRDTLKGLMQKELEQLPDTLKDLEPVQRLNVLCKLIPYVLPKVEAVHSEKGEPETENRTTFSGYQW